MSFSVRAGRGFCCTKRSATVSKVISTARRLRRLPIASARKWRRNCARSSTTAPFRRAAGSINVDDEGTPTHRTVLIEKGILKGYLQDKLNAGLMKMPLTGNGRRESYAHIPMPRMTNTFMLAGESAPEDIIRSVKKGLYAVSFGGGQVDITSGKFVFSASEAYLIEDGKVTEPVKGATLIGNGPDVLTRVSMVGSDLKLDEGVGTCGKDGQSVPVGVGLPTIKIDGLTVGGTKGVDQSFKSFKPFNVSMSERFERLERLERFERLEEIMERLELSQELGQEILAMAKAKGASHGDVVMAESDSFFVTVRMGEVEKISQAGEKRLGLRLFFGNSSASASTSDISQKVD